jgi:hypothetical protein
MMDAETNFINEINEERKIEAQYNKNKQDMLDAMKNMKLIYDSAIENGFNDNQATLFANTYFTVMVNMNR